MDTAADAARDRGDAGAILYGALAFVEHMRHRNGPRLGTGGPPRRGVTPSCVARLLRRPDQKKPQLGAPAVGADACWRPLLVKISSRVPSGSSKKIPPELAPSPCGTAPS